ncbi:hypothetical protein ACWEQ4_01460 [Rhodococcus sp. NPDC003994]
MSHILEPAGDGTGDYITVHDAELNRHPSAAAAHDFLVEKGVLKPADHVFRVIVRGVTAVQAEQVMAERLLPDEDYGFTYGLEYGQAAAKVSSGDAKLTIAHHPHTGDLYVAVQYPDGECGGVQINAEGGRLRVAVETPRGRRGTVRVNAAELFDGERER